MSRAYLEKAREEAAEAHYGSAVLYAQASTHAAQEAQRTQVAHLFPTPVPLRSRVEAREQNDAAPHEEPHQVEDSQ